MEISKSYNTSIVYAGQKRLDLIVLFLVFFILLSPIEIPISNDFFKASAIQFPGSRVIVAESATKHDINNRVMITPAITCGHAHYRAALCKSICDFPVLSYNLGIYCSKKYVLLIHDFTDDPHFRSVKLQSQIM